MYVSHYDGHVRRLVVFIHGFIGQTVKTWLDFPSIDPTRPENVWWLESDLLFAGYESTKDTITGVAHRVREHLEEFYPNPARQLLVVNGHQARADVASRYDDLVLVGHSLGGVILRRALSDAAQVWVDEGRPPSRPILLDARNCMFSPASAGFRAGGFLGLLRAVPLWSGIEMVLRRSSAYTDLQPGSVVLDEIKRRTISFAPNQDPDFAALRANIAWASPDNVVYSERYETDFVDQSWDNTDHQSVCKPRAVLYNRPWAFVRTGGDG